MHNCQYRPSLLPACKSLHCAYSMTTTTILHGVLAILAVLIILGVLTQQRAAGFSSGVAGGVTYIQRRGAEKLLYQGTIVCALAFGVVATLEWFL